MNKIDLIIENIMYAKIIKESAHQVLKQMKGK